MAVALAGCLGCAPSILPVTPSTATRLDVLSSGEPSTVEVRYYAHSPTVSILAWETAETGYGLRAWLRRNGSLIDDHRLYVSTYFTPVRVYSGAHTPSRPLVLTGVSRDVRSCAGGTPCSPPETFEARIPDVLLRSAVDSIPVTFFDRAGRRLLISLHRDLIDAYLGRLDSVVAIMRKQSL